MTTSPKIQRLESIQALRAIAACLVVLLHVQAWASNQVSRGIPEAWLNKYSFISTFGNVGVDMFFVISGVVMAYVTWNSFEKKGAPLSFLKKRIFRIFPVYWVHLTVWVIIFTLFSKYLYTPPDFGVKKALCSFFLIPYPEGDLPLPDRYVMAVAWTLSFEMFFYIVFTCCLFFKRHFMLPIVCTLFMASYLLFFPLKGENPIFQILTSSLLAEFLFGLLIGISLRKKIKIQPLLALFFLVLGICLLIIAKTGFQPLPQGFSIGIPAALIVFGAIYLEQNNKLPIPAWLYSLGNASYSLYLSHPFALSLFGKLYRSTLLSSYLPIDLYIVIAVIACIFSGQIAYVLVEKPLVIFLQNKKIPAPAVA